MNKKRLQELAGIKQSKYVFDNIIDYFIERDNPKILDNLNSPSAYTKNSYQLVPPNSLFYDLGGGEDPIMSPNNILVDLKDWEGNYNEGEEINKFIPANLDKFIKLPPLPAINVTWSAAYIKSKPLAQTINHALMPGGILNIVDHARVVADVMNNLKNYKLVEIKIWDYEYNNSEGDPANTPIGCIFIK